MAAAPAKAVPAKAAPAKAAPAKAARAGPLPWARPCRGSSDRAPPPGALRSLDRRSCLPCRALTSLKKTERRHVKSQTKRLKTTKARGRRLKAKKARGRRLKARRPEIQGLKPLAISRRPEVPGWRPSGQRPKARGQRLSAAFKAHLP